MEHGLLGSTGTKDRECDPLTAAPDWIHQDDPRPLVRLTLSLPLLIVLLSDTVIQYRTRA